MKSISSQIAEGHALRCYKAECLHYLWRAYASAEETIEHLKYLLETGSAKPHRTECTNLLGQYMLLCRKLFNYIEAVEKRHKSARPPMSPTTPDLLDP